MSHLRDEREGGLWTLAAREKTKKKCFMFYVSLNVNFRKIRPDPAKQADTGSQTRIWVTGGGALEESQGRPGTK